MLSRQYLGLLSGFAWLASAAAADAQPLGETGQGLTAGASSLADGEEEQRGLITVITTRPDGSAVGCSGVLLTNDTALTAGHCIDAIQGSTTAVSASYAAGSFAADAIYKFGGWAGDPTGPDIGLLRLAVPVPVNGATAGFSTPLFDGDASGKTVTVYGASTGVYLRADMPVDGIQGRNLTLGASVDGVTTAQGDSGGPAFVIENGRALLAGLTSTSGPPASSAAIAPHRDWIAAATRSFLPQTEPYAAADGLLEEIRSLPEGDLLPAGASALEGASWARAQRVVQFMCGNRGLIGGLFLPETGGSGHHRFACIGRSGGIWADAAQADVDATGASFVDPDGAPWAQAGRAAAVLCRNLLAGSDSGVFTGFRTGTATDPNARMGLLCLGPSTGRSSAVDPAQLALARTPEVGAADWLRSRRDATAWCRSIGYIGGYATGRQVATASEIACIGPVGVEALSPIIDYLLSESRPMGIEALAPIIDYVLVQAPR